MYVLGKIYTEREGSERCLKSWMLGDTEGDDNENSRGDMHPYISVCANIKLPGKEADYPWIHSQPMAA
jgi:hypothetical protein